MNTSHVLADIGNTPWAITPVALFGILSAYRDRGPVSFRGSPRASDADRGYVLVGNVAIIRVGGSIMPRASVFDELFGFTSHEAIGRATDAAVADRQVASIVYDIDSPGGTVYGMPEAADKVAAVGKVKPTIAVANHVAASAAYWYASQCGEVVVTPAGAVGCIGVLMRNVDETKALEREGVKDQLIPNDASPFKAEGWPQTPVTAEGIAYLKSQCNAYGAMFTDAVAKGRGIRSATVERDFGQGRMLLANAALTARMVDRIATLEDVIRDANRKSAR